MSLRLAAMTLLGLVAGCYNYFPVTTVDPQPGTHVSAQLTDSGSAALTSYLGANVGAVDGRLVTLGDTAVAISVITVRNRNGIEHYWKGEVVTLPRGDVATLRERKLALGRSAFLVLAGVGGSVALLEAFGVFNTGSAGVSNPPPPK
ncbi:MAG TPA: hypothetical protein VEU55_11060 [Gemmatimonadales bacterium]|nr:hypothetical protein [Gemmatimonadales bacterium]